MLGNFSEEAQKILIGAKVEMSELNHPYVGTEHLLMSILKEDTDLSKRLKEYNLTYNNFKQEIIKIIGTGTKKSELFIYTPLLKKIIQNAILDSKDNNNGEVMPEHLLASLFEVGEGIAIRILIGMKIDVESIYEEFNSKLIKKSKNKKNKKLLIEQIGINLTEKAENNELDPVIGREKEVKKLLEVLCRRTKNNPLLLGKAGIGKTAIVEEIARLTKNNQVPPNLQNKKIISLDMATLVAGTKYRGEFEDKMKRIIKEIEENDDIIIFIDEIHTLVGAGGAEGAIDASNILKPALARGKVRCIGATTLDEYKTHIEKDSALDRRFQKIHIEEPNIAQTTKILLNLKPIYEKYHQVKISSNLLKEIVNLTDKYLYKQNQPDKSIDILDEVCSKVSIRQDKKTSEIHQLKDKIDKIKKQKNNYIIENEFKKAYDERKKETYLLSKLNNLELTVQNRQKEVTLKDIAEVVSEKTKIPIYEIIKDNPKIITNIQTTLESSIEGQKAVIDRLVDITKRIKLGFNNNKPNSLLFVGPTGVGKTQISKTYASLLVGQSNFIRLDMSEYSDSTAINKIIGSSPGYVGYNDHKNVLEEVKNHPHSVILLDEIDKAHSAIINLLYQILDEGEAKDAKGEKIKFNNTTIIMTSNVGYEKNSVGFNQETTEDIKKSLKNYFPIALLNRVNNILIFDRLTEDNMTNIIKNNLNKLKRKYSKCSLTIDKNVIKELIELSNYKEYGARKVSQLITSKLEPQIIDNILINNYKITINTIKESLTI